MNMAKHLGKAFVCLLICSVVLLSSVSPASAAMAELKLVQQEQILCDVHYGASESSLIIGCMADGTVLTVTGERNGYYRINCDGTTGYIAKENVMVDDNGFYYVNCADDSDHIRVLQGMTQAEYEEAIRMLLEEAASHIGTPYVYGGAGPRGFDCSGYVMYVFRQIGISLNRTCTTQLCSGQVVEKEDLLPGDLVFFQGTYGGPSLVSHIGIYTGNGRFLHASSRGIQYDDLDSSYYSSHYLTARRVLITGEADCVGFADDTVKTNRSSDRKAGAFL